MQQRTYHGRYSIRVEVCFLVCGEGELCEAELRVVDLTVASPSFFSAASRPTRANYHDHATFYLSVFREGDRREAELRLVVLDFSGIARSVVREGDAGGRAVNVVDSEASGSSKVDDAAAGCLSGAGHGVHHPDFAPFAGAVGDDHGWQCGI